MGHLALILRHFGFDLVQSINVIWGECETSFSICHIPTLAQKLYTVKQKIVVDFT